MNRYEENPPLSDARHADRRPEVSSFDFTEHLRRQIEFSLRTFGPGPRTKGVVDHIRKELKEIEAAPSDVEEWIDVIILGIDGAWRAGATAEQIVGTLQAKQARNEARNWPDWRTSDPDKAIEHMRRCSVTAPQPPALAEIRGRAEAMTDERLAEIRNTVGGHRFAAVQVGTAPDPWTDELAETVEEVDRLRAALKNRQAAIEARIDRLEQKPTSAYDEMTPAEAYHEALCDALEAMRGHR